MINFFYKNMAFNFKPNSIKPRQKIDELKELPGIKDIPGFEDDFEEHYTIPKVEMPKELKNKKTLNPVLERLIDLASVYIGCSFEEIMDLKKIALDQPDMVKKFCEHLFECSKKEENIQPEEAKDAVYFLLSTHLGQGYLKGPDHPAISNYHQKSLEPQIIEQSPFKGIK